MSHPTIGKIGVWSLELRFGDGAQAAEAAAELDELGYGAIWIPGGIDDAVLHSVDALHAATHRITIATGILNIWRHEPADVAMWFAALAPDLQKRTLLGLGVSHGPIIGEQWGKPLEVTRRFLDGLDAAGMPRTNTCLAALGPKMVALSGEHTAGAHPYLVTPEHTAQAREILGTGKLLAPEQGVILETDSDRAQELAVAALTNYGGLPNYRNSWKRLGFTDEEIDRRDPRLLKALFAIGGVEDAATRVREHLDAGADHVCIQVITGPQGGDIATLRKHWRDLAEALL